MMVQCFWVDTGSIPSTGSSYLPWGHWVQVTLAEPAPRTHTEATEQKCLEPAHCNKRKPACSIEDPAEPDKKKKGIVRTLLARTADNLLGQRHPCYGALVLSGNPLLPSGRDSTLGEESEAPRKCPPRQSCVFLFLPRRPLERTQEVGIFLGLCLLPNPLALTVAVGWLSWGWTGVQSCHIPSGTTCGDGGLGSVVWLNWDAP